MAPLKGRAGGPRRRELDTVSNAALAQLRALSACRAFSASHNSMRWDASSG